MKTHEAIPKDWPVQPVAPGTTGEDIATDGYCGLSWDDGKVTDMTPAPSARCPFEPFHVYPEDSEPEDDEEQWTWMWLDAEHVGDLMSNAAEVIKRAPKPSEQLVGIVDTDEGIVAYAIGPGNAARIVEALNR
jgi:hypothetical protein